MKYLGLSSDYARVGIFFAAVAVLVGTCYEVGIPSATSGPATVYDAARVRGARLPLDFKLPIVDPQFEDFQEHRKSRAAAPNFRAAGDDAFYSGSDTPCFQVEIDEAVSGHDQNYRTDMFGGKYIETSDLFRSGLETALAASFTEEVWARDRKCFNGSFVVSFDVEASGRIGTNMLVHHVHGSSNAAGIAVLDVLRDMDLQGHRWHDGTAGAGEVRIPVKFRLE